MAAVYTACHAVLRPGGLLVTVTKNMRRHGRLVDLAAITRRLAIDAGFSYLQHVVALHIAIRDRRSGSCRRSAAPAPPATPSTWWRTRTRSCLPRRRVVGEPIPLSVWPTAQQTSRASLPAATCRRRWRIPQGCCPPSRGRPSPPTPSRAMSRWIRCVGSAPLCWQRDGLLLQQLCLA